MRIQVDMFAVELGAAMLLQFQTENGVVRVLADAGEAEHDVNGRLVSALEGFAAGQLRIDLMIGTHYDADHLGGLVDVIDNPAVAIGEAWLPPVANDTQPHAVGDAPGDGNLLPLQIAGRDGEAVLERYMTEKARLCELLAEADHDPSEHGGVTRAARPEKAFRSAESLWSAWGQGASTDGDAAAARDQIDEYFRGHVADAERSIGIGGEGHADEQVFDPWEVTDADADLPGPSPWAAYDFAALGASWKHRRDRGRTEAATLAYIRRSAAKDAINANSLAAVVKALKNKKVNIRCATIPDGKPRRFSWDPGAKRFTPVTTVGAGSPDLLLLGPSQGLVKKHWDRLPVGYYATKALFSLLPIKPITPSNQLSYIMAFEHAGQRILISGDAGCVDFKPGASKPYFADLLAALAPLQVLQVAHHAGNNAHFYRCLLASDYPAQPDLSYLLLSHATDDKHRPSDVFRQFVEDLKWDSSKLKLLFTSTPRAAKVRDLKDFFGAVVGKSTRSGDVRLGFDKQWQITRHAIAAPLA